MEVSDLIDLNLKQTQTLNENLKPFQFKTIQKFQIDLNSKLTQLFNLKGFEASSIFSPKIGIED